MQSTQKCVSCMLLGANSTGVGGLRASLLLGFRSLAFCALVTWLRSGVDFSLVNLAYLDFVLAVFVV